MRSLPFIYIAHRTRGTYTNIRYSFISLEVRQALMIQALLRMQILSYKLVAIVYNDVPA